MNFSLPLYIFSLLLIRQLVNNIINLSCVNVCDDFIILVYSNYFLNFMGKKSFFRNCSPNDWQFGGFSKRFFGCNDLIIITGLHESIWHIGFTGMTVNETIQAVNMWQGPCNGLLSFARAKVLGDQFWKRELINTNSENRPTFQPFYIKYMHA